MKLAVTAFRSHGFFTAATMASVFRLCAILVALVPAAIATPTLAAPGPPQTVEAVVLGQSDQIEVVVDNYPDLKTVTRIDADGFVVLPLVGRVRIGGLSALDAANLIETFYVNGGFIKSPRVRVETLDYQSRRVSVLGEVNRQGLVPLDKAYSVAEILAKVGGINADAGETVTIIRARADGTSERLTVDIGEAGVSPNASALTPVRAGDVIMVPKLPTFSVIGAVARAGTYPLRPRMTVDQALAAAGDVSTFGSRSNLKIRRAAATGGAAKVIKAQTDDAVQPGDIIVVSERIF
ncbi:MAG: SLBB domain-containing protein [Polymorphobacter sp.]